MSPPRAAGADVAALLRQLADEASLSTAATAAGFATPAEAALVLRTLAAGIASAATRSSRSPRRRDADSDAAPSAPGVSRPKAAANTRKRRAQPTLPPLPPEASPYAPAAEAIAMADGASRGNPGAAAYGCAYADVTGKVLCGEGRAIGHATNNVAEYRGAIAALTRLSQWRVRRVLLQLDSELVVRQVSGEYRVKDPTLQQLHVELRRLLRLFERAEVAHIPRARNQVADALANHALDGPEAGGTLAKRGAPR